MINNPAQVKDLIKNLAKGNSGKAQLLQRRYAMERFLERISVSKYKESLVLKGGMLITSMLSIDNRMTRDTDVTMLGRKLNVTSARAMIEEIAAISLADAMTFEIKDAYEIMEDSEYGGVRISIETHFGKTKIPMQLDISTGDAITPFAVNYAYRLMLEDRDIEIMAYNIETILAEKLETLLARSTLNTRMRDFYDIWALSNSAYPIDRSVLIDAVSATAKTRNHEVNSENAQKIMIALRESADMRVFWKNYQAKNDFAEDLSWNEILKAVQTLCEQVFV